jgi:hypothetical protein
MSFPPFPHPMLGRSVLPAQAVVWNTAYTNFAFASGNRQATLTPNGTYFSVQAAPTYPDKRYAEVTGVNAIGASNDVTVGFTSAGLPGTTTQLGVTANSVGYTRDGRILFGGVQVATAPAWTDGDTVMLAYDTVGGKFWNGLNGTWQGNPGAGTGGITASASTFSILAVSALTSGQGALILPSFKYPAPSGFGYS